MFAEWPKASLSLSLPPMGPRSMATASPIGVDEISVNTKDRGVVKVARSALSRIDMHLHISSHRGHELRALGHGVHVGLSHGFGWLLSPAAPLGIVTIPATLAWGAVSAPFCAIGDVAAKLAPAPATEREIRVI